MRVFFEWVFLCMVAIQVWTVHWLITTKEENAILREKVALADVARGELKRRSTWKHQGDYHAIYIASEETGVPLKLVEAVSRQENGGFGFEMGNKKMPSVAYQNHYPVGTWNHIAGSHTIAVYMGKWIWSSKSRRKQFLKYLSKKYHPDGSAQWYKNVSLMVRQ